LTNAAKNVYLCLLVFQKTNVFTLFTDFMRLLFSFSLLLGMSFLSSCAFYHDTTARFNAYFLAKEKMLEAESNLELERKEDFNNILYPLLRIQDSLTAASQKANFEYVIEKASLPVQNHPSSEYVDWSYLEIGKARFYQGDFLQAANTFKYINTNPKTEEARLAALIWLMRIFSETAQFDEAEYVMDIIAKKEPISEKNIALFYKHAAQHYRLKNNFIKTAQYLELVLPYIRRKKEKGRYHYILGQIYQKENQPDLAYRHYMAAFAAHVSYEMDFNSQLQAAEVFTSDSPADIEKMEKYFQKLLADKKNEEYQDKIYYQLANFYLRQKNNNDRYSKALRALEKAAFIGTNPQQKAYTYLRLGELHYQQKNFQQAANYYDSAAQTLRPDMPDYEKIIRQAQILNEFYTIYQIIERQDLYLRLAKLDPEAQTAYFEKEIEKEKRAIDKQIARELLERERNQQTAQQQSVNPLQGGGQNASNWYFYNPVAMAQGREYFARTWNNRPLEDNWRRSRKKEVSFSNPDNLGAVAEKPETEMSEDELKATRYAKLASIEDRLAAVPKTQAEQAIRRDSLEMALYQLGKIYHYQMQEERNALQTLSRLTKEFPETQHLPEALYLMYMICQKESFCESDPYKERVEKEFPNSIYAKLIQNPNYQSQMTQTDSLMESRYQSLYDSFQKGAQAQTQEQIAAFRAQYPNHPMLSKVRLIEILMMARNGEREKYKAALEKFNDEFPQNEQAEFVARLLKALEKETKGGG
jgi:tetratricopeptide (TPR) repeat protein